MAELKNCDNKKEHDFHPYDETIDAQCDGKTFCGAWSHTAHTFLKNVTFWCEGICNCGLFSRGPHGPGAHK